MTTLKKNKKKEVTKTKSKKSAKKKTKKKATKKKGEATLDKWLLNEFEMELEGQEVKDTTPYYIEFLAMALQYMTGGLPGGHMIEIHGESGCGKSYIMYELGMVATKVMGGYFLMFDIERAYKQKYGKRVGLHGNKRFQRHKAKTLEKIFPVMRKYIKAIRKVNKKCPIFIGLDSYPPIQIKMATEEIEKLNGDTNLKGYMKAKKNAVWSEFLGDFIPFMEEHAVTFCVLNQTRMKMNVQFGDPMSTNADDIMQFYSTVRLRGRCGSKIKKGKRVIGISPTWETRKNRDTDPFMKTKFRVTWKDGIDKCVGMCELLETQDVIKKMKGKKSKDKDDKVLYQYKKKKYLFNDSNIMEAVKKYPSMLKRRD